MIEQGTKGGNTMTPKQLATELAIDPKRLRAYLRKHHTRTVEAANTAWELDANTVAAARKAFTKA